MRKQFIIHPFLLGLFPAVFYYANNAWLFLPESFLFGIAVLAVWIGVFWLAIRLLTKEWLKSAIMVGLLFLILFSLGHIINISKNIFDEAARLRYMIPVLVGFVAGAAYLILKSRRDFKEITKILNWISVFLILLSLGKIGVYYYSRSQMVSAVPAGENAVMRSGGGVPAKELRDIYYILLDGYAGNETLKSGFRYDNAEFYKWLEEKGFYVASESRSNYNHTLLSLPSSLNMRYVNDLAEQYGERSRYFGPLVGMIEDNQIQRLLKKDGYKYINIGSGFAETSLSRFADVNIAYSDLGINYARTNFLISFLVYQNPILLPIYQKRMNGIGFNFNNDKAVRYAFEGLKRVPLRSNSAPVFVFAHIMAPHYPFVLDENCRTIREPDRISGEAALRVNQDFYVKKLICANKLVKEAVDAILANSKNPPIIILQSDHGWQSDYNPWGAAGTGCFSGKTGSIG